jgi:RNA polymerase sigma factor (sigma-70 family)
LDEKDGPVVSLDERLLEIDQALVRLEALDQRAAKAVELRYFGGLSEKEAAEALGVSLSTLKRDWEFARTWMASQLM